MNKTFLIILFLALAIALSAQTGLFYIRYDMSLEEAISHLVDEGFTVSVQSDNWIELIALENNYVEKMEIDFAQDDNSIQSWSITYLPQYDEDIEAVVIDALVSHHGDDYDWDEYMEIYYWDLGGGHWVYAGWDYDYETYWVDYTTD